MFLDRLRRSIAYRFVMRTHAMRERYLEWRLGISTADEMSAGELGHPSADYHDYGPTSYVGIDRMLGAIPRTPRGDVFVDFGSGKGRAVILAAMHPFRKVVGVELSPRLNEIALRNLVSARPRLRCKEIDLILGDAASYPVPDDASFLYFQNSFSGRVLEAVLDNIAGSLVRKPRQLFVITHDPGRECRFQKQIQACDWLTLYREIVVLPGREARIYTN